MLRFVGVMTRGRDPTTLDSHVYRILIIEDDAIARCTAHRVMESLGHSVVAVDASAAMMLLGEQDFDVVVTGIEPTHDAARDAGALSVPQELVCLPRPLSMDDLVEAVTEIEHRAAIRDTLEHARRTLIEAPEPSAAIVGRSPETLIEAELFGHERGAFTGAVHRREGRFKAADGATLFLDEINGLSLAAQAKLLRVLQDGSFTPIGTNTPVAVDVRLISATNRELKALVADGTFRDDLYYRIKVLDLELPPLRERAGELPLLVAYFLLKHAPAARRPTLSPRAWAALSLYSFPGNVRELEHAIQHAIVLAHGLEIDLEHLPRDICAAAVDDVPAASSHGEIQPLSVAVREFERAYLQRALELTNGNKTQAARLLGMSRKHLWEKLRRLGTDHEAD
jgi:DNA-binding NtrC family response regulator